MKSLSLVRLLLHNSRGVLIMTTVAGILSGLFSAGVVALISRSLHPSANTALIFALGFAFLVAGKIFTAVLAQLLLTSFTQGNILDMSLTLSAKLLQTPLRALEKRGSARILATLTDDVSSVTWAIECIPRLATNIAVLLGCGAYLAWLSWQMFACAVAATAIGAVIYRVVHTRAFKVIHAARDARSRLFKHFRTLTSGSKELMLHRGRREEFLNKELRAAADDYRRHNLTATWQYAQTDIWTQCLLYGLIGLVLFAYPAVSNPSVETLTGYVFAIMYMMAPLWTVIGTLPVVTRGQVALNHIESLGISLENEIEASPTARTPTAKDGAVVIEMKQVVFSYADNKTTDEAFSLGPLNFQLRSGELVFVVGGNGSGKSTFVKVLTGLYAPRSGELLMGTTPVTDANREWYREHFSVLFSDFHLFEGLLGLDAPDLEVDARRYLELLQIADKVDLKGRTFSTTDLSQGQRKRLALVTAYLEDRPVFVFDEWAADQDPEYKHIFYSKLLPDLRNRGKAVVVITHDDRYFDQGDRVIKLDDGRAVEWNAAHATAAANDNAARVSELAR